MGTLVLTLSCRRNSFAVLSKTYQQRPSAEPTSYLVYYSGGNSGTAAPSFRGSEAPKLIPVEKSRITACPPPTAAEYVPTSSILCPFAASSSRTFCEKRFSISTSQPSKVCLVKRGASNAAWMFIL